MKILATLEIGEQRVQKVDRGFGPHWECDCSEYLEPKPQTARAWCRHCDMAAGVMRNIETIPNLLGRRDN